MTGSPSRRRLTTIVAASLWLVLAFLVWNVCFDYGVRMAQWTIKEYKFVDKFGSAIYKKPNG